MAFEATKKDWSELYMFFRLLAEGMIEVGGSTDKRLPIAKITREEHDGIRSYFIGSEEIIIKSEQFEKTVLREDFQVVAQLILDALRSESTETTDTKGNPLIASPEGVEAFLDEVGIFNLASQTVDRINFSLTFFTPETEPIDCILRSRIGKSLSLLDGGRAANLKLEQTGVKFASPTVSKVNALETTYTVMDRMLLIERLGGVLKYADVADRVFRANLAMIDLHLPRLLAEMLRTMHLEGINRVSELIQRMNEINPLKVKTEFIEKHHFYEHKLKQLLIASALGMRPAKIYTGEDSAIGALILLKNDATLVYYPASDRNAFGEFLYKNSRFEVTPIEKDKYGTLERENYVYYFKLNLKIMLTRR
ncbi:MAG: HpaII family restriction endonuclease [Bacteroidaceae bacterium]